MKKIILISLTVLHLAGYSHVVGSVQRVADPRNAGHYLEALRHETICFLELAGLKASISGDTSTITKNMVGQTAKQASTKEMSVIEPSAAAHRLGREPYGQSDVAPEKIPRGDHRVGVPPLVLMGLTHRPAAVD